MANNNPRTEQLKAYQFQKQGDEPLSDKPIAIRLPKSADQRIREIPASKRSVLLREWILMGLMQMEEQELTGS
ncbi:hypothetical protein NG798_05935 [Ancylothrix sp. C2]|uniref:hypothetical protein n=1 Tax=Ancylothrix sp. D3o TaxID=2953691 RepID=UPI0021BAB0D8|nr:hypothetical protein [Ancylothrix sp. D3o]MCT7949321.1 hypothetical protein [Ancylothrix sp. D3o]